jgi:hypothetical protein
MEKTGIVWVRESRWREHATSAARKAPAASAGLHNTMRSCPTTTSPAKPAARIPSMKLEIA